MKKAFLALFLSALFISNAFGFTLSITDLPDGTRVINHNSDNWIKAGSTDVYSVLVEKGIVGSKKPIVEFHSVTDFSKPEEYKGFPFKIKRIYTYGALSCSNNNLMILVDLYVDPDGVIRYTQAYQQGEYVVNMTDTKIKQNISGAVCGESI